MSADRRSLEVFEGLVDEEVCVSREFHGAGGWWVHRRGANRSPKIFLARTECEAELVADAIRDLMRRFLREVVFRDER